jgi:hypothetical protein
MHNFVVLDFFTIYDLFVLFLNDIFFEFKYIFLAIFILYKLRVFLFRRFQLFYLKLKFFFVRWNFYMGIVFPYLIRNR